MLFPNLELIFAFKHFFMRLNKLPAIVLPAIFLLSMPAQAQQQPATLTGTMKEVLPVLIKNSFSGFKDLMYLDTATYSQTLAVTVKDPAEKGTFKTSSVERDDSKGERVWMYDVYMRNNYKSKKEAEAKYLQQKKWIMDACPACKSEEINEGITRYTLFMYPGASRANISLDIITDRDYDSPAGGNIYSVGIIIEAVDEPGVAAEATPAPGITPPVPATPAVTVGALTPLQQQVRSLVMEFNEFSKMEAEVNKNKKAWVEKYTLAGASNVNMNDFTGMGNWTYSIRWTYKSKADSEAKTRELHALVAPAIGDFMVSEPCTANDVCFTFRPKGQTNNNTTVSVETVEDVDRQEFNTIIMVY